MKGERTEVRRWTLFVNEHGIVTSPAFPGMDHIEVLEAAPLLASLEQLAGEWERARTRGVAPAYGIAALELRSLIESLNQETDTNAD